MSISIDIISNHGAGGRIVDMLQTPGATYADDSPVDISIDNYTIISHVDSGGDADVYLALHCRLNLEVAIKLFKYETLEGPRRDRADRECLILEEIAADLDSIPNYRDHGWLDDGRMWVASDYVDGLKLDEHCKSHNLNLKEKVRLLIDLCRTVESLHDRRVLHRDIKPSNTLVCETTGKIKLIDFGIASVQSDSSMATLTIPGAPIGSIAFMAPEQAAGKLREITIKSDVYGLAATAYYILTDGCTPHLMEGTVKEKLDRVISGKARKPDSLPNDLCKILLRALDNNPEVRQPSAAHLADDFENWLEGIPIVWTKPSTWQMVKYLTKSNPTASVVTGIAVLAIITAIVLGYTAVKNAEYDTKLRNTVLKFVPIIQADLKDGHIVNGFDGLRGLENLLTEIVAANGDEKLLQEIQSYKNEAVINALKVIYGIDDQDADKLKQMESFLEHIDNSN